MTELRVLSEDQFYISYLVEEKVNEETEKYKLDVKTFNVEEKGLLSWCSITIKEFKHLNSYLKTSKTYRGFCINTYYHLLNEIDDLTSNGLNRYGAIEIAFDETKDLLEDYDNQLNPKERTDFFWK